MSCTQKGASATFDYLSTRNFKIKNLTIRDVDCVHPPTMRYLMKFVSSVALTLNVFENDYRQYMKPGTLFKLDHLNQFPATFVQFG
jgi:hypothetical protein